MNRHITRINTGPEKDENRTETAAVADSNLGNTGTSILLENTEDGISSILSENNKIMKKRERVRKSVAIQAM